jgi:hypothetical protein
MNTFCPTELVNHVYTLIDNSICSTKLEKKHASVKAPQDKKCSSEDGEILSHQAVHYCLQRKIEPKRWTFCGWNSNQLKTSHVLPRRLHMAENDKYETNTAGSNDKILCGYSI